MADQEVEAKNPEDQEDAPTVEETENAMKLVLKDLVLDETTTPKFVRNLVAKQLGVETLPKAQRQRVKEMMNEFVEKTLEDRLKESEMMIGDQEVFEEGTDAEEMNVTEKTNEQDDDYSDADIVEDKEDVPQKKSRLTKLVQQSDKKRKSSKKSRPTGQPLRPKTAYLFFQQEKWPALKEECPDLSFTDMSRRLGDMWNKLSVEEKQPFVTLSAQAKDEYMAAMQKWKEENPEASQKPPLKRKKSEIGKKSKKQKASSSAGDSEEDAPPRELTHLDKVLLMMKPKRRRKDDIDMEEVDAVIPDLLERMRQASQLDAKLQKQQQPAIHRLRMLDEVIREATKQRMHEFLLDKGLLRRIRDWLQILPDGSLPNLTMRTRLYELLKTLPIEQDYLMESEGLGKSLMALWKSPQETPYNKNLLRNMIEKWSRPLFKAETDYRKLEDYDQKRQSRIHRRAAHIKSAPVRSMINYQSRHAKIPEKATFDYAIRPKSNTPNVDQDVEDVPRATDQTRQDRIKKRLESFNRQSKGKVRAVTVRLTKD